MDPAAPFQLPEALKGPLAGYEAVPVTTGCSGAAVFRLSREGYPARFLKAEVSGPFSEVPEEAKRLTWLGASHLPCPRVLAFVQEKGRDWLLTSEVAGRDLASSPGLEPPRIAELAADALQVLHRLPHASCPFDMRLDLMIRAARERLEAGLVDASDLDEENLGRALPDLLDALTVLRPSEEDLVVTHGDPCLPNLIVEGDRFTGFVDCARLGGADRYRDLALTARSIGSNLGTEAVESFFRRYGMQPDAEKLRYYRLLDEFF